MALADGQTFARYLVEHRAGKLAPSFAQGSGLQKWPRELRRNYGAT
jgi:hypothetical protein